jgi:hypothetical protein
MIAGLCLAEGAPQVLVERSAREAERFPARPPRFIRGGAMIEDKRGA